MNLISKIIVKRSVEENPSSGLISIDNKILHCSLGKNGISTRKIEGDSTTPTGQFRLLYGFFRQDRIRKIPTLLPMIETKPDMGWCDEPKNANYNQQVKLPFNASHEILMRDDHLYDICLVMDYNISQRIKNRGSAVFFHLTAEKSGCKNTNNFAPTQGCVAIKFQTMRLILPRLSTSTIVEIQP